MGSDPLSVAADSLPPSLAVLSHDLKTPLTSLKMSIHLLLEDAAGNLTAIQQELLASAAEDVERLQAMIVERLDKPRT